MRKEIGCGPCYQKECPLGHHRCMTQISVDEVYQAAVGLFNEIDGRVETDVQRGVL